MTVTGEKVDGAKVSNLVSDILEVPFWGLRVWRDVRSGKSLTMEQMSPKMPAVNIYRWINHIILCKDR